MRNLNRGIVLAAMIALLVGASQVVSGDSHSPDRLVVILADRQAIAQSDGGELVQSFLGLVSTLREGESFVFISLDEPTEMLGPAIAGSLEFKAFREQAEASLASSESLRSPDLLSALAESYNYLGGERAAIGSTVYLLSGGDVATGLSPTGSHVGSIVDLFRQSGWPIVGLILPGASPETLNLINGISENSGGGSFELSVPDGFKSLSDQILRDGTRGSLTALGQGMLSSDAVLTSTVHVAPGTRQATLLFFKEGRFGSLRLSNPKGFEASAGDRTSSSVTETPHVVIWRLLDPMPGDWKIEMRGVEGVVSAWHFATNKYRLVLVSSGVVPVDEPSTLVAYVLDGDEKVTLDGVQMVAKINTPEGASLIHELNDDGVSGDPVAGDCYFSANISPVAAEGDYTVNLELTWPDSQYRISSQASFTARAFPSVEITPVKTEELRPGERAKVATAFVNIQGQPYAVAYDALTFDLTSNADQVGVLEVKPQRMLDEGRAWSYDIFFTPQAEGRHTLVFRLNMEYAGREYGFATDSIVLTSAAIPVPAPAPTVERIVQATAPTVAQSPLPQPRVEPSGFPWGLLAAPIAVAAVLLVAAAYWLTRTRPFGYIYNDRNELLVHFGTMKRHPIMRLLFKDSVRGEELGVPGLEGVSFEFSGEEVDLRSRRVTRTIRVNNEPVVGVTKIRDRSWIGTHGRLYNFLLSPLAPQPQPGMGDD